jgi:hypothetical protein
VHFVAFITSDDRQLYESMHAGQEKHPSSRYLPRKAPIIALSATTYMDIYCNSCQGGRNWEQVELWHHLIFNQTKINWQVVFDQQ